MIIDSMIGAAVAAIKQTLEGFAEDAEKDLTPGLAETMTRAVQAGVASATRAAFRIFIESKETFAERVETGGERHTRPSSRPAFARAGCVGLSRGARTSSTCAPT